MSGPLAGIGMGASLIGGVVGAAGALGTGASQQAMYNYQAGVAQLNQRVALQNADYAQTAGGSAAYQEGLKVAATVGQEKANQGASGVDVNSGSPAAVRSTTTALGQYDQDLIRTNFAKQAYGQEVEAAVKGTEAKADVVAGDEAVKASQISAASSILGSVSSVSSKWLQASSVFGAGSTTAAKAAYDVEGNPV